MARNKKKKQNIIYFTRNDLLGKSTNRTKLRLCHQLLYRYSQEQLFQLGIQTSMQTSHQDPKNGTKEFLKSSTLFNTSILQQEKEQGSLATLLQRFQTKYCILTYYRVHQLTTMNALQIIARIPTNKYQPHYKSIRDMKNLNLQKSIKDFKKLPFSIVYGFNNPDNQLDTLNKIILE